MDIVNGLEYDEIPFDVEDDLGELSSFRQAAPGVFYVTGEQGERLVAGELFLVEKDTPCLSDSAKAYGKPLPHHPDLLYYRMDEDRSGWRIVEYEVIRYKALRHLPLREDEEPHTAAVFSAEYHPEYFGSYPAPLVTPKGLLARYHEMMPGVFAIETATFEKVIALCYPVWSTELSEYAQRLGEQTGYDINHGIDQTLGYLFFSEAAGCVALYELGSAHREIRDSALIDRFALMNAVWERFPDYAVHQNKREVHGKNDGLGRLFRWMGATEAELSISGRDLLVISPDTGTEYLRF
ncbi:MAG: hypothetical protein J6X53_08925 [Abditibacteriota bacterium]|nr:hypothetical protein [Abditibacteriota bacterium]